MNYYYVVFTVTFDNGAKATAGYTTGFKRLENVIDANKMICNFQDLACIEAVRLLSLPFKDDNVLIESVSKL